MMWCVVSERVTLMGRRIRGRREEGAYQIGVVSVWVVDGWSILTPSQAFPWVSSLLRCWADYYGSRTSLRLMRTVVFEALLSLRCESCARAIGSIIALYLAAVCEWGWCVGALGEREDSWESREAQYAKAYLFCCPHQFQWGWHGWVLTIRLRTLCLQGNHICFKYDSLYSATMYPIARPINRGTIP